MSLTVVGVVFEIQNEKSYSFPKNVSSDLRSTDLLLFGLRDALRRQHLIRVMRETRFLHM